MNSALFKQFALQTFLTQTKQPYGDLVTFLSLWGYYYKLRNIY